MCADIQINRLQALAQQLDSWGCTCISAVHPMDTYLEECSAAASANLQPGARVGEFEAVICKPLGGLGHWAAVKGGS